MAALVLAAVVVGGCGKDASGPGLGSSKGATRSTTSTPAPARPDHPRGRRGTARADGLAAATRVIRAWSDTLRRGDVAGAADYFALPSVVQNGTPVLRLTSRRAVRAFNIALPCGARLLHASRRGQFTIGSFALTERPHGSCGAGTGGRASVAFVVRQGKIAVWLRVEAGQPMPSAPPAPDSAAPPSQGPLA